MISAIIFPLLLHFSVFPFSNYSFFSEANSHGTAPEASAADSKGQYSPSHGDS